MGGHAKAFRVMIVTKDIAKYELSLRNHLSGIKPMYRTREEREQYHLAQGGRSTKSTWFRKGGFTCTITIPTTPGGKLATMVRESLASCPSPDSTKTRVVEMG